MTILEIKKQSHKGVRLCEDFEEYIIILPKQLKYSKNIVLKQLQKNHTKILKRHEVNSFGAKKGQLGAESSENCPFLVVRKRFKTHVFAWFCRLLHKNVKI